MVRLKKGADLSMWAVTLFLSRRPGRSYRGHSARGLKGGNRYGHRDALMILLADRHGLRAAEAVDPRWEQIDFKTATFHVRRVSIDNPDRHKRSLAHFCVRAVLLRQSCICSRCSPPAAVRCQHGRAIRPFVAHLRSMPQHFGARKKPSTSSSKLDAGFNSFCMSGLTRAYNSASSARCSTVA